MPATEHSTKWLQRFCLACWLLAAGYGALLLEPARPMLLGLMFGPPIALTSWLAADTRRTHVANVVDIGWLFYAMWPILLPWYVYRTRGPGAWPLTLRLYVLSLGGLLGFISGAIVNVVVSIVLELAT